MRSLHRITFTLEPRPPFTPTHPKPKHKCRTLLPALSQPAQTAGSRLSRHVSKRRDKLLLGMSTVAEVEDDVKAAFALTRASRAALKVSAEEVRDRDTHTLSGSRQLQAVAVPNPGCNPRASATTTHPGQGSQGRTTRCAVVSPSVDMQTLGIRRGVLSKHGCGKGGAWRWGRDERNCLLLHVSCTTCQQRRRSWGHLFPGSARITGLRCSKLAVSLVPAKLCEGRWPLSVSSPVLTCHRCRAQPLELKSVTTLASKMQKQGSPFMLDRSAQPSGWVWVGMLACVRAQPWFVTPGS